MIKKKFYITTPIYYVNASPHIGHSYTNISADCLSRFKRSQLGYENVWFLTGTDEHGQKIQKAASEAGLSEQDFVDKVSVQFQNLWDKLNITHNDFIRTTQKRHVKTVQQVLDILYQKSDIYLDKYEGWYCAPCETFWTDTQLVNNNCPDCSRPVERIQETNFFFKLSNYQDWLISYIEDPANNYFIGPPIRKNEVLSFLKLNKLTDLCISRPKERMGWGIELPFSASHVTYVWFDALINYISAVGEFDSTGKYSSPWWEPDVEVVQLIGKDILRQHAIYWPIMLKALGIRQPDSVFAHGWWLIQDEKMSKSKGNVVSPLDMVTKFGIDTYRYFLLRDVSFGLDGNLSESSITKRFNSDLANDLGNLVYRTLAMLEKYFQGLIPEGETLSEQGRLIKEKLTGLSSEVAVSLSPASGFNFSAALEKIWELINMTNKYIEDTKPWNLAKENKTEELKSFLRLLVDVIRELINNISPFLPQTASLIKEQIGSDRIKKGLPLFPRIEIKPKS